jgi:DNA polymerase III delta subunit
VSAPRPPRHLDPFSAIVRLSEAIRQAPLPPILFLSGDDEWFVGEGARRLEAAFREGFPEGEVATYDGVADATREAIDDVQTVGLFSTNRLVVLEATALFHGKKLTADDVDALLDEAAEAALPGGDARGLARLGKRARLLANAAGVGMEADSQEAAKKVTGKVRRSARAAELAALLELAPPERGGEEGADLLSRYAEKATAGDNTLLVLAVSPEADHPAVAALSRRGHSASLVAAGDDARRARLTALGFERALDLGIAVDSEVFEILCSRGRLTARSFISEFDRLVAGVRGKRVLAEEAARLVADEKKEYGSDFVEAVLKRRFVPALQLLDKLMTSDDFTAFRPFGGKDESPAKKGPKGEAAFFPLLGLLAGEFRRVLSIKAALTLLPGGAGVGAGRRADYRTFADRLLPALKSPPAGSPSLPLDGHPFVLHKAYLASFDWSLSELIEAMKGIAAIDEGVKSGTGDGRELLETFLLSRATPPGGPRAAGRG